MKKKFCSCRQLQPEWPQKKKLSKNVERMNVAHISVENANKEIEENRQNFKDSRSIQERTSLKNEYVMKKKILDGAYTELKRAQDATLKAIKVRQTLLNDTISEKNDECMEQSTSDEVVLDD